MCALAHLDARGRSSPTLDPVKLAFALVMWSVTTIGGTWLVLAFLRGIGLIKDEREDTSTYTPPSTPTSTGYSGWYSGHASYKPEKESPYTRDWASVSRKYKEARGWRCEECYVNLFDKRHRRLLHVHHRDNDPKNNYSWNLIALCVICHSERPGAGHKRLAGAIRTDGRYDEVRRLRW